MTKIIFAVRYSRCTRLTSDPATGALAFWLRLEQSGPPPTIRGGAERAPLRITVPLSVVCGIERVRIAGLKGPRRSIFAGVMAPLRLATSDAHSHFAAFRICLASDGVATRYPSASMMVTARCTRLRFEAGTPRAR
jgi:hypothetical protein